MIDEGRLGSFPNLNAILGWGMSLALSVPARAAEAVTPIL